MGWHAVAIPEQYSAGWISFLGQTHYIWRCRVSVEMCTGIQRKWWKWRKFEWDCKKGPFKSDDSNENCQKNLTKKVNFCENSPKVWQKIQMRWQKGPLRCFFLLFVQTRSKSLSSFCDISDTDRMIWRETVERRVALRELFIHKSELTCATLLAISRPSAPTVYSSSTKIDAYNALSNTHVMIWGLGWFMRIRGAVRWLTMIRLI